MRDPTTPVSSMTRLVLGVGMGRRVLSRDPDLRGYALAGGMGLVIDVMGEDRYESSNFSQGMGYFYGAGIKLDFGGNDDHGGARYGHAAAAHFGVGFFLNAEGADRYSSTGPTYNGGTAWGRSAALFVDAGLDGDLYDFRNSHGLGRGDHGSWGLFIDEGGLDRYLVPDGLGRASDKSLGAVFDLAGEDDYLVSSRATAGSPGNGLMIMGEDGSLFVDR